MKSHGEGKDAVQGAIRLLKRLGYLEIVERRFRGQFMYVWVVWETRQVRKRHHEQPTLFEHILRTAAPGSSPVDDGPLFRSIADTADRCGKSASARPNESAILAEKTDAEKPVTVKPSSVNPPLVRTDVVRTENQQQQHRSPSARNGATSTAAHAAADSELGRALDETGLGEGGKRSLVALPELTPAIVRRCYDQWKARPGKGMGALVDDIRAAAKQAAARTDRPKRTDATANRSKLDGAEYEAEQARIADAIDGMTDDQLAEHKTAIVAEYPKIRLHDADPRTHPGLRKLIADRLTRQRAAAVCTSSQAEAIYNHYPRKVARLAAIEAIERAALRLHEDGHDDPVTFLQQRVCAYAKSAAGRPPPLGGVDYRPHPATWFDKERFHDDDSEWQKPNGQNAGASSSRSSRGVHRGAIQPGGEAADGETIVAY